MIFYNSKFAKLLLNEGFIAITIMFMIFTIKDSLEDKVIRHENIHIRQWYEVTIASAILFILLGLFNICSYWFLPISIIVYYILYCIEYLARIIIYTFTKDLKNGEISDLAYKTLSFENEAYSNQDKESYFKLFGWIKYLFK